MIMQFNNREDPFAEHSAEHPVESPSPLLKEAKKEKAVKPKITDFDIMEVVGIGNFGKVHKAYNKKSERIVALKVLKKESVAAMKHVDHIINEREVLQYLSDRNKQFLEELQPTLRGDEDDNLSSECPFLMDIYSSF
jgi:serine/threonine protein kinase